MFSDAQKCKLHRLRRDRNLHSASGSVLLCAMLLAASAPAAFSSSLAPAQQADSAPPVIVQPGAPGQPSKTLPPSTKATLPPRSHADVEFMQGMIMHHSQAVEMTALIASHTDNKDLRSLGAKISSSQSDEIKFMQRWLAARGESLSMRACRECRTWICRDKSTALMPGMLSPEQMEALRKAQRRRVRPLVFDRYDSASRWRVDHGQRSVRHCGRRAGRRHLQLRDRCGQYRSGPKSKLCNLCWRKNA